MTWWRELEAAANRGEGHYLVRFLLLIQYGPPSPWYATTHIECESSQPLNLIPRVRHRHAQSISSLTLDLVKLVINHNN